MLLAFMTSYFLMSARITAIIIRCSPDVIRVMRVRYDVLASLSYTRTTQIHRQLTPRGHV